MIIRNITLLFLFIFLVCAGRGLFTAIDAMPIAGEGNNESLEATSEAHHEATQPEAQHVAVQPEAQHEAAIQPEAHHEVATSEAQHVAIQPEAHHEAGQPEAQHVAIQPEAQHEAVQPEAHHEAIQPEAHHEATQPEAHHEVATSEAQHEAVQPEAHHEAAIQPEAHHEATQSEAHHEAGQPEAHHEVGGEDPSAAVDPSQHHHPEGKLLDFDSSILNSGEIKAKHIANQAIAAMVPTPLQGVLLPELVATEHDVNKTETQIREGALVKEAIPYAIATATGMAISTAAMVAITGSTMGAASIPALGISGALGSVAADKVYKWGSRKARLRHARKGKSDVEELLNAGLGKKTAEELHIEEEIAAEKNKTFKEKVKESLPIALGGAAGAIAGGLVGDIVGEAARHAFSKPKVGHAMRSTASTFVSAGSATLATRVAQQGTDLVM